jgi:outer membrane protein assembly factor BamB
MLRRARSSKDLIKVLLCLAVLHNRSYLACMRTDADLLEQLVLSKPLVVRWQYPSEATLNLTPATDGERIYLPLAAGSLVSLRVTDGQLVWKTDIGGEITADPMADEQAVYLASQTVGGSHNASVSTGTVRALGREGGTTLWMRTLSMPLRGGFAGNKSTLFGGAADGRVYGFNKKTGEVTWLKEYSSPFSSEPALFDSLLCLGNDDGTFFALQQSTGKELWRYQTRGPIRSRPAEADGLVYFGSADGYVYAIAEKDGRLRWRFRTGAAVQAVARSENGLLIASLDNFVYFVSLARGNLRWKRQLAGRLPAQPLVARGAALFTPLAADAGVVLDLRNGKPLNSLPIGDENTSGAAPVMGGDLLLLTTRHGLLAFSQAVPSPAARTR